MDGVRGPPGWRIHRLSGGRAGTWSVSVSGNRRITFKVENGDVADKAGLSPEMALRIEKAFGVSMDTLLRMAAWHEGHVVRRRSGDIGVKRYEPGHEVEKGAATRPEPGHEKP